MFGGASLKPQQVPIAPRRTMMLAPRMKARGSPSFPSSPSYHPKTSKTPIMPNFKIYQIVT